MPGPTLVSNTEFLPGFSGRVLEFLGRAGVFFKARVGQNMDFTWEVSKKHECPGVFQNFPPPIRSTPEQNCF